MMLLRPSSPVWCSITSAQQPIGAIALAAGIPTHHSKPSIAFEDALQHHSIARLEDVQRQNVAWKRTTSGRGREQFSTDRSATQKSIEEKDPEQLIGASCSTQSFTSMSTPLGRSSFIKASIVLAERAVDVDDAAVGARLEVLTGVLVDVRERSLLIFASWAGGLGRWQSLPCCRPFQ